MGGCRGGHNMKKGDRVTHRYFKWLKSIGTIIDIEKPIQLPYFTARIFTEERYKIRWDMTVFFCLINKRFDRRTRRSGGGKSFFYYYYYYYYY